MKEALFSTLGDLTGMVVADLYAGSGALGIEALSRGAAHVVFVEQNRRAAGVIRDNLRVAGLSDAATIVVGSAERFCAPPNEDGPAGGRSFDLVLVDPPYDVGMGQIGTVLGALASGGRLRTGALVVIERDRRTVEDPPGFLVHDQDRTYGDTLLRYFTHRPSVTAPQGAPTP